METFQRKETSWPLTVQLATVQSRFNKEVAHFKQKHIWCTSCFRSSMFRWKTAGCYLREADLFVFNWLFKESLLGKCIVTVSMVCLHS